MTYRSVLVNGVHGHDVLYFRKVAGERYLHSKWLPGIGDLNHNGVFLGLVNSRTKIVPSNI